MRQLLKDLAVICAGQGAPQGDNNYCENGTPFVKAGNLQELLEGKAITSIQKVSDEVAKKHKLKLYPKGTILFAKSGMSCMKGYVYVLPQSAYVVSHLACVTPNEDASEYLRYFFNYHKPNQLVKDAAYPSISLSDIGNLVVDMKSESERNAIVSVLQHAESVITLRQKELQKLDELVKARFIEMFGDLETNPKGYEQRKLGSLANKISDGVHAKPEYTETGRPFISVVNINKGVIDFEECKFVSEDAYQKMIKSTHPERGDILYTKVGATYGIPAYVDTDTEFCLYVSVCLIKPKHDEIDARFLALSMSMPYIKRQADSRIKGIGVPDLHLNQIREFDVICPPRHEQEAFVTFVEQTDKSKLVVQQSLEKLETLKKALMQKYFG